MNDSDDFLFDRGEVPHDSVWRTGANSPTVIHLEKDIQIGTTLIPKGQYSIYTIPSPREWTLIFNTDLTTWPTDPNRSKDFAQVQIPVRKSGSVRQQFTIEVTETKEGGVITFGWDDLEAMAAFKVVD